MFRKLRFLVIGYTQGLTPSNLRNKLAANTAVLMGNREASV